MHILIVCANIIRYVFVEFYFVYTAMQHSVVFIVLADLCTITYDLQSNEAHLSWCNWKGLWATSHHHHQSLIHEKKPNEND